jgi:hypothetical protein
MISSGQILRYLIWFVALIVTEMERCVSVQPLTAHYSPTLCYSPTLIINIVSSRMMKIFIEPQTVHYVSSVFPTPWLCLSPDKPWGFPQHRISMQHVEGPWEVRWVWLLSKVTSPCCNQRHCMEWCADNSRRKGWIRQSVILQLSWKVCCSVVL